MYFEFSSTNNREQWKYPFTGKQLLNAASTCFLKYNERLIANKNELDKLLNDPTTPLMDYRVDNLRKSIEFNARQTEACSVFVMAFKNEPDRIFQLSLGDVIFFGLDKS